MTRRKMTREDRGDLWFGVFWFGTTILAVGFMIILGPR